MADGEHVLSVAEFATVSPEGYLVPKRGPFPVQMAKSQGTALPLIEIKSGLGVDLIHFKAGEGVAMHVHPGAHILNVFSGEGELDYYDQTYPLRAGMVYRICSQEPHAVHASLTSDEGMTIQVIGNDHRPADSSERLDLVE